MLDIDETLLRFIKKDIWESIPNRSDFINIMYDDHVFVFRPNIYIFLDYLFSKFVVSIWTWGNSIYAELVANILTNGQPNKFKDILSLEDCEIASVIQQTGGKDLNYLWYDFNEKYASSYVREQIEWRNSVIDTINEERISLKKSIYSRNPMKLFSEYSPMNTILIDDAFHNLIKTNEMNMILIKPFGTRQDIPILDSMDNEFDRIIQILDTIYEYHQSLIYDNVPLMTKIHHTLPLLEYHREFIFKNQQHSLN